MFEVIKNFFENQWGGMISGLLTSAFIGLLKLLFDYIATIKSEYSGTWIDAVYDENNKIAKVDIWEIRYDNRSHKVKGHIKRYYGKGTGSEWNCVGQILNDEFYLIYEGLGRSSTRNGCAVAKRRKYECDNENEGEGPFIMQAEGVYSKINDKGDNESVKIVFYKPSKESLKLIRKEGIVSFLKNTEPYKGNLK